VIGERLDICVTCGEPFVVPERLMGLHDNRLVVGLRCASCGNRKLAVVSAGKFNDLLIRQADGTEALAYSAQRAEIERFVAALAADEILPEDF
jgi:DNA-directed RNA polymerase subunit RPC12/RpoP